ncbi:NAD(P)-dependent glycerol-3-phosphate dehydrogenase, partial [bacterium]
AELDLAVKGADLLVLAIPSQFIRQVLKRLKTLNISGIPVLSVTKGIEADTLMRISQVIRQELGKDARLAVLSGPTIALEVAKGLPATAVISAHKDRALAEALQHVFTTDRFRIYTNSDMAGVELGGSLKNVIAIACGISDGLGFAANAKAALLCRGLAEISRLGKAMGAKKETFSGISGLGDLVTTCISRDSRNRFVGEQIGKGRRLKDIVSRMNAVAEGITTAKSAYLLSKKYNISMPIAQEIYAVLYKDKDPRRAVSDLMAREMKGE